VCFIGWIWQTVAPVRKKWARREGNILDLLFVKVKKKLQFGVAKQASAFPRRSNLSAGRLEYRNMFGKEQIT